MQTHRAPKSFCGVPLSHALLWLLLISIGVASRWMWVDIPNFKPVGAIALFCGFYFHRRWIGITAATSIMLASDIALGFYQWTVMITVYGSMILACLLGSAISRRLRESNSCTHRVATIQRRFDRDVASIFPDYQRSGCVGRLVSTLAQRTGVKLYGGFAILEVHVDERFLFFNGYLFDLFHDATVECV